MLSAGGECVTGVDLNSDLVQKLRDNNIEFVEQGLESVYYAARENMICFSESYPVADIYIVAVPTPYIEETKQIDTSYLCSAVSEILNVCADDAVIVVESTIAVGTIDKYIRPLIAGRDIHLAHAPERIIPGNLVNELSYTNRVIGADSTIIGEKIKRLYSSFCKGEIITTTIQTAEMVKLVENTFRDVNIAYANEIAQICNQAGVDVYEVIKIANMHPRVNIMKPGPGVGGHCIAVDPWFLVTSYPELTRLIHTARIVNNSMPEYVLLRVSEIIAACNVSKKYTIGLYGLTYKENVDDIRESPTLQLLNNMRKHLAVEPIVYDPYISRQVVENQCSSFPEFLARADIVVIMVGHSHIIENQKELLGKIVFDTRNAIQDIPTYKL